MKDIVIDGVTGFVLPPGDLGAMAKAIKRLDEIDRSACREHVVKNFGKDVVARKHVEVFERVIAKHRG